MECKPTCTAFHKYKPRSPGLLCLQLSVYPLEQRAGSPGLAQSQGEWHSGSQILKVGPLLDFFLLVRTPSTTVGTLPELGSTTWMWTGAPVEELLALHPELARWPWPQEVTCAQVWRSARERNQLCVPGKQQCLRGAAVGVPRCGNARSRESFSFPLPHLQGLRHTGRALARADGGWKIHPIPHFHLLPFLGSKSSSLS